MSLIHPTAIINSSAKIDKSAQIGPYCIIGENVIIEKNVILLSNVVISGRTTVGEGTKVWPFTVLGGEPQDLKFDGEDGSLVIGKNNSIREHVTMHFGTEAGGLETTIGDNNLFMAGSHVAHDCLIGNNCVFANNVMLAGHVIVGDFAILGGLSAVHQWTRIGSYSFLGGFSALTKDLIPFGLAIGNRAVLEGLNLTGLRRRNFDSSEIKKVKEAYSILFESSETEFKKRVILLKDSKIQSTVVNDIIDFVSQKGNRSYCLPES
ncbi:acyl-ACP--UDP-N-acetylglucosamine O-acyltransferase [Hyphomicrobiales bacterium]|jgi:UDP-N-acetylglucosamine acyltransferase|nr:acyl-ACP--UDP-N-acetylglucosamine O-acyltransferase [Hyphomicrobiales bacterium]MDB9925888.1 acyl-ACP--UDP-N-acetylglucosamine O-acyltransferase [Hyphomicrobiales bacterium]|tara:strand:+ start:7109 stop:7900 length:792 start_codon:yes stop_codon:yes gene_type:complete